MAGAFREEKNADKIFKRLSTGYKPNASRPTNMAYTRYFMAVTPPMRKQIKRKKNSENGQSRSLAFD
jgi:hypothetical protein